MIKKIKLILFLFLPFVLFSLAFTFKVKADDCVGGYMGYPNPWGEKCTYHEAGSYYTCDSFGSPGWISCGWGAAYGDPDYCEAGKSYTESICELGDPGPYSGSSNSCTDYPGSKSYGGGYSGCEVVPGVSPSPSPSPCSCPGGYDVWCNNNGCGTCSTGSGVCTGGESYCCCCDSTPGSCDCTSWVNDACGVGVCTPSQRRQIRDCEDNCDNESRCINDPTCQGPVVVSLNPTNPIVTKGDTLTFTTIFSDPSEEPSGNNLIQNGSFEDGINNGSWWGASGSMNSAWTWGGLFGDRTLRLSRKDGGDAYYVSNWLDNGSNIANQTFTLSFSARTQSGNRTVNAIALQSYPTGGNWANSRYLHWSNSINVTPSWQRYSLPLTFPGDINESRFRVVLRVSQDIGANFFYDGVAVERRSTKGVFTDLDLIQLNLENEGGEGDPDGPTIYTGSLWPVRLMFAKNRGGPYPQDSFQFAVGDSGSWSSRQASYSNNRWYLGGSDIALINGATILAGFNNTFFFLNDTVLTAQWRFRLEEDFPVGSYFLTLYAEDLSNLQDILGNLYLNNTWYFHRLGILTVEEPTGTISGEVHDNAGCQCVGSVGSTAGWSVTCNGANASIAGDTYTCPGSYSVGEIVTLILDPYSSWDCVSCGSYTCSQQITVASGVNTASDFYQCQEMEAWWQTSGGSVHADGEIDSDVPSGEYLMLGDHGVISGGSLETHDGDWTEDGKDWWANSSYEGDIYGYDWWVRHLREETIGTLSGSDITGETGIKNVESSSIYGDVTDDDQLVLLREGDLTIHWDITVDTGAFLMVVVSGKITVDPEVENLQGIFVADEIEFATAGSEDDFQLFAEGTFIGWDGITINRNIGGAQSALNPSVIFTHRPDFIRFAPGYIKRILYNWQQVPG